MTRAAQDRTLVLLRHAKAEQVGPTDFERALSRRGLADGAAAGGWLAGLGVSPDLALVSAARRTVETWTAVADGAGWSLAATLDEGLYSAGPETALDLLRERGFAPEHPVGVALFVEEEGSRFGLACLGSRLATGATSWEQAEKLRDRDGVWFLDALAAAGERSPATDVADLDLPSRMAQVNAMLDVASPRMREALLVAFLDRLQRPVR